MASTTSKKKSEKRNRIRDVVAKVENEGLGYAIQSYYGRNLNSESDELNDAWAKAYDALAQVEGFWN